jgi:hypothetical protein
LRSNTKTSRLLKIKRSENSLICMNMRERELTSKETRRKNTTGGSSVWRLVFVGAWNEKWKPKTLIYRREGDYFTWITSRPFCTQVLHFLLYFPLTPPTANYLLVWTKISQNWIFFFNQFIKLIKVFQFPHIFKKYMKIHMRITSIFFIDVN